MTRESSNLATVAGGAINPKDGGREGFTLQKFLQLGRLFVPGNNYAIAKVSRFNLIDIKRINSVLGTNFKGAILDVDECMAPHHGNILLENTDTVTKMVQDDVRVAVFSNMKAGARYMPFIETVKEKTGYEIPIVTSQYAKPDRRGFIESREKLQLSGTEQAVMIGDNLVTDGGSIRAGIPFIKVDPIPTPESAIKKLKRLPQTGSRNFYSWLSNLYDTIFVRETLNDEDFRFLKYLEEGSSQRRK